MVRIDHNDSLADPTIVPVDEVRLVLGEGIWAYEAMHRPAIDAAWAALSAGNAALYNGRFYVLTEWRIADGALTGTCLQTDYASFLHWRAAGFPAPRAWNAFAMAALHLEDGALLIGRMAAWTANAGRWYPPAGSLEEADVTADRRFDVIGNMRRELAEEIGLQIGEGAFAPGWTLIVGGGRLAMLRRLPIGEAEDVVLQRFSEHLAQEAQPELDALRFLRRPAEADGLDVPPFVLAYLDSAMRR